MLRDAASFLNLLESGLKELNLNPLFFHNLYYGYQNFLNSKEKYNSVLQISWGLRCAFLLFEEPLTDLQKNWKSNKIKLL